MILPFGSILDIIRGEARILEGLHNLGIKGENLGKLLRLPVNPVEDNYALDIRHPAVTVRKPSPPQHCRCFVLVSGTSMWISGSVIRVLQHS